MFLRVNATTIATDRYSPTAAGRAAGDVAATTRAELGQLPAGQPHHTLVPQGFSLRDPLA
jgi:hypothetical protein